MAGILTCRLDEIDASRIELAGGKGANLASLMRMGLPVPPGFVVTTKAYREFIASNDLRSANPVELRQRIPDAPMPEAIGSAILAAYELLGAPSVAVRSSGTAEDLASASFAGQHDTYLNVMDEENLLQAVKSCWASLWSPRAVDYRNRQGFDDHGLALAVVIQRMVPAEWAGVMFTADPVMGRKDRIIIEAVEGLGEGLVSGEVTPSRYVISKAGTQTISSGGDVPSTILKDLAELGVRIETSFGTPQDIEWAYAEGGISVLQARPLTALHEEPPTVEVEPGRHYNRGQLNAALQAMDHMPVPLSPLDYSLIYRPAMQSALEALRYLGFSTPPLEEICVEIAEGVIQITPPTPQPTFRILALPAKLARLLQAKPQNWLDEFQDNWIKIPIQVDAEDLTALSDRELIDHIECLGKFEVDMLRGRFGSLIPILFGSLGLTVLLRWTAGRNRRKVETELLSDVPCITTDMNHEIARLAETARASTELQAAFARESPNSLPDRLRRSESGRALLAEIDTFLSRYGYRESTMMATALPSWRDDPSIVFGILKGLVASDKASVGQAATDGARADRAREELAARLSRRRFSTRRLLLAPTMRLVKKARFSVAYREDSHFYLGIALPVIRKVALELGARMAARGVLDTADDIFLVRAKELRVLGTASEMRDTVRRRREARKSVEGKYTVVPAEILTQATSSDGIQGEPASAGRVTGKVRIIPNEREFWKLERGEVLVAPYTNPAWTPLFALAGAVVTDAGGTASHAAIVAREYGIPAVMGTRNASRTLTDGQLVLVDGNTGKVLPVGEPLQ